MKMTVYNHFLGHFSNDDHMAADVFLIFVYDMKMILFVK